MTRICGRCAAPFERAKRNPDRFCYDCEKETLWSELYALLWEDRSGIHSLHETFEKASAAMKADAEVTGAQRIFLTKVVGQPGARAELRRSDPMSEHWDRADEAMARAEYERETS